MSISNECEGLLALRGSIDDLGETGLFLVRLSGQGHGLRMLWKEAGDLLASRWLGQGWEQKCNILLLQPSLLASALGSR